MANKFCHRKPVNTILLILYFFLFTDHQRGEIKQECIDLTSDVPEAHDQPNSNSSQESSSIYIQEQSNELPVIESVYTLGNPTTSQTHQMNEATNTQDRKLTTEYVYILQQIPDPSCAEPSDPLGIKGNTAPRLHMNAIIGKSSKKIKIKTHKKKIPAILKSNAPKKIENFETLQHKPTSMLTVTDQQPCSSKASLPSHTATEQTNPTMQMSSNRIFYPTTSQMPIFILSQPNTLLPQPNTAFSQPSAILPPPLTIASQSNPIFTPANTISSQSNTILTPPNTVFSQCRTISPLPKPTFSQTSTVKPEVKPSLSIQPSAIESKLRKILMQPMPVKILPKPTTSMSQPNTTIPQTITTTSQPNAVRSFAVDLNSLVFNLRQDGRLEAQNQDTSKDSLPADKKK